MRAARLLPFALLSVAVGVAVACSSFDAEDAARPDAGQSETGTSGDGGSEAADCPQVAEDCAKVVCHADGTRTTERDDSDVPRPTACARAACSSGFPTMTPVPEGTPCGNGGACTADGKCLGTSCVAPSECDTGFCTDGVCCAEACDGKCMGCNTSAEARGRCAFIPFNVEDPSYGPDGGLNCTPAVGGAVCDGEGRCLRKGGTVCADNETCLSGQCPEAEVGTPPRRRCRGYAGDLCSSLGECMSNSCVRGVCE